MRKITVEIVNMIMVKDVSTGKVLVLDKRASEWNGLTFPGGHVEKGESFTASAIRELREETGLVTDKLTSRGVVHWGNRRSGECYLEFLYSTDEYSGTLLSGTEEGELCWMYPEELKSSERLSSNFDLYLPMFFEDKYSELYFDWDGEGWSSVPEYM